MEHRRSTAGGSRSTSNSDERAADELGRRRRGRGRRRAGAAQPLGQPSRRASRPRRRRRRARQPGPARRDRPPGCCPTGPTSSRRVARPTTSVSCSTSTQSPASRERLWSSGPPCRQDCPGCWPATSSAGWRRATSCTSPCTGPPDRPAPASTTRHSPGGRSAGTTGSGSNGQPAAAVSCAGFPSLSAPVTATAATSPTRCCSTAPFRRSSGSAPGDRRPAATA